MVDNARSFIYIAVMNYLPTMEFSHPRRYCWGSGQEATKSGKGVGEGVMGPRGRGVPRQGDRWRGRHGEGQKRQVTRRWGVGARDRKKEERKGREYWGWGEMGYWRPEAGDGMRDFRRKEAGSMGWRQDEGLQGWELSFQVWRSRVGVCDQG